ncbi:MAG: type II toxin-antitoxin system VapC family toxin [Candidatus Woesearchaeota archaeon]
MFFDFISDLDVVSNSYGFALEAAKLNRELKNKGKVIDDNDLLIAALLKSNNISNLVTKNEKYFIDFDFINIVNY